AEDLVVDVGHRGVGHSLAQLAVPVTGQYTGTTGELHTGHGLAVVLHHPDVADDAGDACRLVLGLGPLEQGLHRHLAGHRVLHSVGVRGPDGVERGGVESLHDLAHSHPHHIPVRLEHTPVAHGVVRPCGGLRALLAPDDLVLELRLERVQGVQYHGLVTVLTVL